MDAVDVDFLVPSAIWAHLHCSYSTNGGRPTRCRCSHGSLLNQNKTHRRCGASKSLAVTRVRGPPSPGSGTPGSAGLPTLAAGRFQGWKLLACQNCRNVRSNPGSCAKQASNKHVRLTTYSEDVRPSTAFVGLRGHAHTTDTSAVHGSDHRLSPQGLCPMEVSISGSGLCPCRY